MDDVCTLWFQHHCERDAVRGNHPRPWGKRGEKVGRKHDISFIHAVLRTVRMRLSSSSLWPFDKALDASDHADIPLLICRALWPM